MTDRDRRDDEPPKRANLPRIGGLPAPPAGSPSVGVGPVQGQVAGPSVDVGPVSTHPDPGGGGSWGHGSGAPHAGSPSAGAPGAGGGSPGSWSPSTKPGFGDPSLPKPTGKGALSSLGQALAKKKAELLATALVGAVAGGAAGTIGGMGAGFGAGWMSGPKGDDAAASIEDAPAVDASAQGRLRVLSQPSGASVSMDDHALGATPVDVSAAGGMHTLRVTLDGHEDHVVHVSVPPNESMTLSVALNATVEDEEEEDATEPEPRRRRPSYGSRPRRPERDCLGERHRCENACRSAVTDCEMGCPGCSSCTTTEGWDSCRQRCESCRQSCRNNRTFCENQCRAQETSCHRQND